MCSLTHAVHLFNPDAGRVFQVYISAFCAVCCVRRGAPVLSPNMFGGRVQLTHSWRNPCGHEDTLERLWVEVETQCAQEGCVVLASENFYPYCTPECADGEGLGFMHERRQQHGDC